MSPSTRSSVNQRVDAVFVLSVKTFHDRIRHIESELACHGIAFEWVFEHDANELTQEQIDAVFAPSDLERAHQSLVLKHIETWRRCVERGYRRVLVFEDDAVLGRDFERVFGLAMDEAEAINRPHMVYLGCGDNKYVDGARGSPTMLLEPGIDLPATDATVLDRRAAELRLAYVGRQRITRPADWLMREADAAMGIAQYWLREPIVEQGSMNGRFASVLDSRRTDRGRHWNRLRFRWDRWRRRTLGSTRPAEARADFGEARATVRRDIWAITVGRWAAAFAAIGAFVAPGLATASAGLMVLALLAAPSGWQRLKHACSQPMGRAALLLIAVLALAMLWSPLGWKQVLREWLGWRQFVWLLFALALFDTARSRRLFAALFTAAAALVALFALGAWALQQPLALDPAARYVVFRNHVTQSMAFAAAAALGVVLAVEATRPSLKWTWALAVLALVGSLILTTPGRSGFLLLGVVALAFAAAVSRGVSRVALIASVTLAFAAMATFSPVVAERFEKGVKELQNAEHATELTSMGIRVVIWRNTLEVIGEAPVFGHGLGAFSAGYARVAQRGPSGWRATVSADPHNQYLFFLAETGLLGLTAFGWFLLSALRQPARGMFRVVGLALLLGWCLTSLFSSHFQTFNEGHMIALFLGVFLAGDRPPQAASSSSTVASTAS